MKTKARTMTPRTGGKKGVKPARYELIPVKPLRQLAEVCGFGATKYEERNWERGVLWGLLFGAMLRHIESARGGEWDDPESGLPHLAHAAWHCMALMAYKEHFPELDDRSQVGALSPF